MCRSSLAAKASPILTAAGAILAADFVQSGLTQDDTTVLARLMTMLTDPLVEMRREKEEELVRLPSCKVLQKNYTAADEPICI